MFDFNTLYQIGLIKVKSIYTGILSSPAQTIFVAENRLYESLREQWFKEKVDENSLTAWEQSRTGQDHPPSRKKLETFRKGVIEAYKDLQGASGQARDYWSRIFNARLREFVKYLDPCSFTKEEMLIEEWQSRGKLNVDCDQAAKIFQEKIKAISDEIEILKRNPVQEGTIEDKERQLKSCQIHLAYYQAQAAYQEQLSIARDAAQSQDEKAKSIENARNGRNQALWNLAPFVETSALCISGGGVRSASFALGALQSLARCSYDPGTKQVNGVLTEFDYISTVSGGGYIGSWLTRLATPTVGVQDASFTNAVRLLAEQRLTPKDPEPQPVRSLRDFTSYLAPQWSLFSGDTWTIITTYLRNVSLNWTMLIPIAMAMAALPLVDAGLMKALADSTYSARTFLLTAAVTLVLELTLVALALPGDRLEQAKREGTSRFATRLHSLVLLVSAYCFAVFSLKVPAITWVRLIPIVKSRWFIILAAGAVGVWLWKFRSTEKTKAGGVSTISYFGKYLLFSLMTLVGWMTAIWLLLTHLLPNIQSFGQRFDAIHQGNGVGHGLYTTTAVPVILLSSVLANWGLNGVMSAFELEEDREWWARSTAYILLIAVGWFALHSIVLFSWALLGKIAVVAVALLGPVLSYIGYSPKTASGPTSPKAGQLGKIGRFLAKQSLLLPILGAAFFVFFLVLMAVADSALLDLVSNRTGVEKSACAAIVAMLLLLFASLASWAVNVNTFSMHGFYRNRLMRAFLGSANLDAKRRVESYTKFAPADNIAMADAPATPGAPIHVINTALNIVATKRLALQERKAASYTISPLHCGSGELGYQRTISYAGERGPTLATAMAISGAAASPNMGYHSSAIMTLLMTLFNVRLGWWWPNPGKYGLSVHTAPSPSNSLDALLSESIGNTNDDEPWVYLSDGGHFENLGIYEMVLRRCATIVVIDGSADAEYSLEDFASACRKIYVDFGIPIELDTVNFGPSHIHAGTGSKNRHCCVYSIRYDCVHKDAQPGTLFYVKASLCSSLPADVKHYAAEHKTFPHESTVNQFFRETQFESYRRLGSHVVDHILGRVSTDAESISLNNLRARVKAYIPSQPPPVAFEEITEFLETGRAKINFRMEV